MKHVNDKALLERKEKKEGSPEENEEEKDIASIYWADGAPKETLNEDDFLEAQYIVAVYNVKLTKPQKEDNEDEPLESYFSEPLLTDGTDSIGPL